VPIERKRKFHPEDYAHICRTVTTAFEGRDKLSKTTNCPSGSDSGSDPTIRHEAPNGILKRLYYDLAGSAYRPAIAALTNLVPTTQILFGSDNPFIPLVETAQGTTRIGFSASDLQRIGRDNALNLLPRLKAS
jgi:Amidohydrolase